MRTLARATAATLTRYARLLAYATIGWNVIEGVVAIAAGTVASSAALVGFGLDSFVEVFSGGVVLWRLRGVDEERERTATSLIGVSFLMLAAYVTFESVRELLATTPPDTSTIGIVLAAVSLLVMPGLAIAKRRVGTQLGSRTVLADATETLLCAYLSLSLLVGLVLNALVGWWWADPVAALAIAALAAREGVEAVRGDDHDDG